MNAKTRNDSAPPLPPRATSPVIRVLQHGEILSDRISVAIPWNPAPTMQHPLHTLHSAPALPTCGGGIFGPEPTAITAGSMKDVSPDKWTTSNMERHQFLRSRSWPCMVKAETGGVVFRFATTVCYCCLFL